MCQKKPANMSSHLGSDYNPLEKNWESSPIFPNLRWTCSKPSFWKRPNSQRVILLTNILPTPLEAPKINFDRQIQQPQVHLQFCIPTRNDMEGTFPIIGTCWNIRATSQQTLHQPLGVPNQLRVGGSHLSEAWGQKWRDIHRLKYWNTDVIVYLLVLEIFIYVWFLSI